MTIKFVPAPINYGLGVLLIFLSVTYSFVELNKRIGLKDVLNKIKSKFSKNN
ncbi:hypothetical protein GCM10028895_19880 [Pontibacter rugosus]